ncbi:MAG: hypothetical protein M0D55_01235 [Elusimicrobiota bacterium]|nr:MAG: hypothetical protein M0D55_01235 [Elusimicrobiota bacterium]
MGLLLCACYGAWGWAAAGAAGTVLNPYGVRLYAVLWEHGRDLSSLRALITEWATPRMGNEYMAGYWILFAFSVAGFVACVAQGAPLPREHVLAALAFGLAGSRSLRTTAYVTLAVFPLGLLAWSRAAAPAWWSRVRPWALGAFFLLAAWRVGAVMRRDGFLRHIKPPSNLELRGAGAFLRDEKAALSGLKLFNPYDWGGWIDENLYPDYRVFMDGRYLFAGLLKEMNEAERTPILWKKFMDKHGVELAMLQKTGRIVSFRGQTSWRSFDAYAMPQDEWALVYWDRQVIIYVRRSKVPAAWVTEREFRLARPHDLRHTGLRVLSGWANLKDVEAEIERYERVINDPVETAVMRAWLENFRKGLAPPSAARKPTRPRSSKEAAPKP